jgi:uncharacterized protein (TIGR04255 family)
LDVAVRPHNLPNYTRPPVSEVVLGIQFAALGEFHSYHLGLLWDRVRDRYPTVSEQLPIGAAFETFGGASIQEQKLQFEALLSPPMPRYWFEAPDGSLMQVQQDRLIHNWRKRETDYPRYEPIRDEFVRDIEIFQKFLEDYSIPPVRPNQAEISYINTIELADGSRVDSALERVASIWRGTPASIGEFENAVVQSRFVLRRDDQAYARMHVVIQPAIRRTTGAPVLRLDLTVRGKPTRETLESALEFIDYGREAIVRSFTDLTTPEMHKVWGRTDG